MGRPVRRSRRVAFVGLAVGLVLSAGPLLLWLVGGTSVAGVPPAAAAGQAVPSVPRASDPAARPVPAESADGLAPLAAPVRIRVPDAGVNASIVETGVDEKGAMAVPEDIRTVGWYRFGAAPGAAAGSAVLAGHVDDRIQGRGAFYRLADLATRSSVEVTLADGTVLHYRVSAVERVGKAVLPADRLFARDGPPQLALVTCGGDFDRAVGRYTENVVVTATMEDAP